MFVLEVKQKLRIVNFKPVPIERVFLCHFFNNNNQKQIKMKTIRPTQQIYSNYTAQDFEVWKILFNRQLTLLKPIVSIEYLNALHTINFTQDKIPDFEEVNTVLQNKTSWSLEVVPNISEQKEFFNFLSRKKFTTTCWLRTME